MVVQRKAAAPIALNNTIAKQSQPVNATTTAIGVQAQQQQPSLTTSIANTKTILSIFEKYQKERLHFVQTIAEQASREGNVDVLQQAGAMSLLKPLLGDPVPAIQQAAAVALGRLANYNPELAAAVVNGDILPQLIFSLREQNRFYKKSAAFVLRSIARHSPQLAQSVVDSGALQSLVQCLEEFDPSVKESAAWALGYIARHNAELAQAVVDAGAIPLLVLCVQEPEIALKRIAISALSDISKHSPELGQAVVDGQTIPIITPYLSPNSHSSTVSGGDARLQRQVLHCLTQLAKHTPSLAESVVDGDIFPHVFHFLSDPRRTQEAGNHGSQHASTASGQDGLKYATASLICEMAKHTLELAQLVVNGGGIAALVSYLHDSYASAANGNGVMRGGAGAAYRLPAVMALGYLAAFSETLALAVIVSKAVPVLIDTLSVSMGYPTKATQGTPAETKTTPSSQEDDHAETVLLAATCWTLGQIGRHSPEHAKNLTEQGVLLRLLKVMVQSAEPATAEKKETSDFAENGADLKVKSKRALKSILMNTMDLHALEPLLKVDTPANILKYVIGQLAKILPQDVAGRRNFVTSGGLAKLQEIASKQSSDYKGSKLAESIRTINECYPEEIVRYYSPGYSNILLSKMDNFDANKE